MQGASRDAAGDVRAGGAGIRVCIAAEHASRRFGGEAILPFHYFRLLRLRGVEAWLVVHARTREELEAAFPGDLERIVFVPDLWIHKVLFKTSMLLPRRIGEATVGLASQLITQYSQRGVVQRLVKAHEIDVVHQPIPVSPKFPSMMAGVGAPVVMGPLNGGMDYPAAFRKAESLTNRIAIGLGRSLSDLMNFLLPGKRRAKIILVANERTRLALPSGIEGRVIELVENGVDLTVWRAGNGTGGTTVREEAGRFVFIGRLVDWKAVQIVIEAVSRAAGTSLEVIGDGPMRGTWEGLAASLGIQDRVRFLGWLSQEACAEKLQTATALVLPSLWECGGAVVLEAMALGRAVIATNWGGPADYLNESCGILIEPKDAQSMIEGFAAAMLRLKDSPELAAELGAAGRQRLVENFDWQRKIDQILEIYAAVKNERAAERRVV